MKSRRLFCEISPLTYKISQYKCCMLRSIRNVCLSNKFAKKIREEQLPVLIYKQNSLMRRRLGDVDLQLQENKVVNLSIAVPKVSGIVIKPNEIFSFWNLVGECSEKKGYIKVEDERFIKVNSDIFRTGKIFRESIDKKTGVLLNRELIKENYAKVMYHIAF